MPVPTYYVTAYGRLPEAEPNTLDLSSYISTFVTDPSAAVDPDPFANQRVVLGRASLSLTAWLKCNQTAVLLSSAGLVVLALVARRG